MSAIFFYPSFAWILLNSYNYHNNHLFLGKTCEDVRKYQDFRIVMDEKIATKLMSKPNVKRSKIYEEDLVMFSLHTNVAKMDKPRYIGQAILDISEIVMYNFHYNLKLCRNRTTFHGYR